MDQKTRDLAREIYEQYEEVIRVIWQAGTDEDEGTIPVASREWYENSRFFNVGEKFDSDYKWSDYRNYGFICAGGGQPYRRIMEQLEIGETIYAYVSKYGYVGLGTVVKKSVPFREAVLSNGQRLADVPTEGKYDASENDDMCDWIALVNWQYTVAKNEAVRKTPFTVSTACKIYEHRQEEAEQIKAELAERSGQETKQFNSSDAPS